MNDKQIQYAFIQAHAKDYPITTLVDITSVSHKWLARNGSCALDERDKELYPLILKIFEEHADTYAYGRDLIRQALKNEYDLTINEKRIARIMKKYGLHCRIRRKRFKKRPQPHGNIPNILNRNFKAKKPGIKFSVDITYIEGKKSSSKRMYVCAIKVLFNGEIISYSTGTSQEMKLVYLALEGLKKKDLWMAPVYTVIKASNSQFKLYHAC